MEQSGTLIESQATNALLSWALVTTLALVAVVDAVTGHWLWVGFSVTLVVVALVPAVLSRNPSVMVSCEALLLATAPIVARAVGGFADPITYVSAATLAIVVAVQLVTFSDTRMPPWFAVAYVVMTTMTVAAMWAVVQYYADVFLGTSFIPGRKELMWDLVGATVAGLAAGLVFEFYFRRQPATLAASVRSGAE